jgi:CheY-like chemotaxis protein
MADEALFLLVEDDPNDAALIRRAFVQAKVLNPLHVVSSGEEAIEYLSGVGRYSNRVEHPLPELLLLDLRLQGIDGFEVLQWIRAQPSIRGLRVVVLSGSQNVWDVRRAYQEGANSFMVKPADFERFVEVSRALNGYWLWLAKAPELERPEIALPSTHELPGATPQPKTQPAKKPT